MPRLQILHHKSYHPYNEKNKQRVREDEAKARAEQLEREQVELDAASVSRLNALRQRAGTPEDHLPSTSTGGDEEAQLLIDRREREKERAERKAKREQKRRDREKLEFDWPKDTRGKEKKREVDPDYERQQWEDKWQTGGHINFWADAENGDTAELVQRTPVDAATRKAAQEADKLTVYLERPDRETKPWYTDRDLKPVEETGEEAARRRARDKRADARAKVRNDPLTGINKSLASQPKPPQRVGKPQSERERALAMLAKRKGPTRGGWETPDSSYGSWSENFERQKDRAKLRFSDVPSSSRNWD